MEETTQSANPQPVTSQQTPSPSRNLAPLVAVAVITALLASLGTYFVMSSNQKKQAQMSYQQPTTPQVSSTPQPTLNTTPEVTTSPNSSSMSNWKTYTKLGVEFKYPSEATVKEDTNGSTQYIADFKLGSKDFRLDRLTAETENEAPYNQTKIIKTINGVTWKVVPPEQTSEYCDAGNCGKTAPSYYVYKNGYRYSFTYYADDLRTTIEDILTTFRFTN